MLTGENVMTAVYIALWAAAAAAVIFGAWAFITAPSRRSAALCDICKNSRFAHRGLYGKSVPENSLEAFRRAKEAGYGSELDAHLSKDGRVFVMHDENVKRMCGVDAELCGMTADGIAKLRLSGTDEHVPELKEVLSLYDGKYPLIIELKTHGKNHAALAEAVIGELKGKNGEYLIESFDPRAVRYLRKNAPDIMRGQLAADLKKAGSDISPVLNFALKNLLTSFLTRPDFIAYRIEDRNALSLRALKKLFSPALFYWTVRDEAAFEAAKADGAGAIFERGAL